jgi:hypothetical protein
VPHINPELLPTKSKCVVSVHVSFSVSHSVIFRPGKKESASQEV